jgi:hypothetical protein
LACLVLFLVSGLITLCSLVLRLVSLPILVLCLVTVLVSRLAFAPNLLLLLLLLLKFDLRGISYDRILLCNSQT